MLGLDESDNSQSNESELELEIGGCYRTDQEMEGKEKSPNAPPEQADFTCQAFESKQKAQVIDAEIQTS